MGSAQSLNWEECNSQNCWLQSEATQLPQTGVCQQGRIPPFSITINTPQDAVRAVQFATAHKIKMVIKNTGHEYMGRSTGPDSLQIWTHQLKALTYNATFQPENCSAVAPSTAITMGAGVLAEDAYHFATKNNRTITLGAYGSVGVGGGFAMGGGHGPLGPKYGLAVDNLLQFKLVTAAGDFITANACHNKDLFSALRGGGGGSFGVVTEVTYLVHPPSEFQVAQINVQPRIPASLLTVTGLPTAGLLTADAVITDFLTRLASYSVGWADKGWAGYLFITAGNASFVTFRSQQSLPSLQALVDDVMTPGAVNTPVGFGETLAGRLIPRTAMATASDRATLAETIIKVKNLNTPTLSAQNVQSKTKPIALQIYSTGPPGNSTGEGTLVNTNWRGSIWEVVVAQGWVEDFPQAIKNEYAQTTNSAMDPLRALTGPGGGSFFGTNYAQLLAIKQVWDPLNVFNVWKGVGWTGASDPSYRCYANN
ncbi:hypothetical protein RQP46_008313 [Phenoliferia psychrophenolica]